MPQYNAPIEDVIVAVAEFCGINRKDIFSNSRVQGVVEARHIIMYCLREKFKLSFPIIGALFKRDHTSVMHACENAPLLMEKKEKIKILVNKILKEENEIIENEVSNDAPSIDLLINDVLKNKHSKQKEDKLAILTYANEKYQLERSEYHDLLKEALDKKNNAINKAKTDYLASLKKIKENKIKNRAEYFETINSVDSEDFNRKEQYLSPKKELLSKFDKENNLKSFLPSYNEQAIEFNFPIKFDRNYFNEVFKEIDLRTRKIITNRFGFFGREASVLDALALEENVTRERIRQIINAGINKIYFNNYGGLRQIINLIANKIIKEDIVDINQCLKEYFIFDEKDRLELTRLLLVILLSIKWIKEFDFVRNKFLINILNEKNVLEQIDHIKLLIEKIVSAMPDLVENKWEYIFNNLKLYEYFQERKYFLNEKFLRACYDNYLFESEIVVYKTERLKKYRVEASKELTKTSGIPDEYKVFFE